jgi:ubiquinone/menaquinone biosynthesis C-methylase UbiE
MIKQSRKIRLPADLYSRNTFFELLTQYILDQRTPEEHQRSLEILDIGGYEGKLAWFMPQHTKVTVLDQKPAPEEGKTNYVQGDARMLPFPDNSFDLVLSSDMIEHIAPEDRLTVLREMQRVSRRHIILAAPFQSIYNQKAEELINSQFREYTGQDHPFLSEHLQNGLPELEQFEQYLSTQPLSYIKIGEGNIYNWYLHQLATAAGHPLSNRPNPAEVEGEKIQTFNEFFNDNLSKLGNFRAPTYRTVLFCDKSAILNRQAILEKIEEQNTKPTKILVSLAWSKGEAPTLTREVTGDSFASSTGVILDTASTTKVSFTSTEGTTTATTEPATSSSVTIQDSTIQNEGFHLHLLEASPY